MKSELPGALARIVARILAWIDSAERGVREFVVRRVGMLPFIRHVKQAKRMAMLREVADIIHRHDLDCFLVGGMAYEALRGRITRLHADIDVAFLEEHKASVVSAFAQAGYRIAHKSPYVAVAHHANGLHVDLFTWTKVTTEAGTDAGHGQRQSLVNTALLRVPDEFLEDSRVVRVADAEFKTYGAELMACILPLIESAEDRQLVAALAGAALPRCEVLHEQLDLTLDVTVHEFRRAHPVPAPTRTASPSRG